ncbi:response regulator transcription factor [Stenotrophomonas humi]
MTDSVGPWVLVVEDDPEMRDEILVPGLRDAGFNVIGAGSAVETYRSMLVRDFSVFILDVGLPDEDGLTIANHLRKLTNAGIVILTGSKRGKADCIRALEGGADAYITKPVDVDVLAANVRSLLRRLEQREQRRPPAAIPPSGWHLATDGWNLTSPSGIKVQLTHTERLFFGVLATSPGEAVSRETIIARLTESIHDFDPHRLEMLVHRLRRKTSAATNEPLPLNSVRGIGYVLLAGTD